MAARLESLAEPGGICISNTVYDHVSTKLALSYADLGEQTVKNIAKPVRVFRVLMNGAVSVPPMTRNPRRHWRGGVLSLTGLAIVVGTIVLVQHLSLKPPHTHASIPPLEKDALPLPSIPSVVVLPFANPSGDPKQEYFSDGITDQLINDLSRLPDLFVIARNSSFTYKGRTVKEQEIGKQLGVKYVLEGSAEKSPDRVRIGIELVDASTGTEMWTQRYDRPLKDIFTVKDEIVGKVVTTLGLIFKLKEMNAPHFEKGGPTDNVEAFDDWLRATEHNDSFTKSDILIARQWIQKAIAVDPGYAPAYSFLASTYMQRVMFRWSENPAADLKQATALAQKALVLDDSNSMSLEVLCHIDWMQRRYDQSVAECEKAVALNPNDAHCYENLSVALTVANRSEEAVHAGEKAMRLDPARPDYYGYFIAAPYVQMGRYQEAIPLLKRHIAVSANQPWAHVALIVAYTELGHDAEARAEAAEFTRTSPDFVLGDLMKDDAMNKRWESDLRKAGLK